MKGLKDLVHNQNSEILIGNMVIPLTFDTIFAKRSNGGIFVIPKSSEGHGRQIFSRVLVPDTLSKIPENLRRRRPLGVFSKPLWGFSSLFRLSRLPRLILRGIVECKGTRVLEYWYDSYPYVGCIALLADELAFVCIDFRAHSFR